MKNLLLLLFALTLCLACDKDEKKPSSPNTGGGGGTGNPNTVSASISSGLPSNTNAVHGVYYALRSIINPMPGAEPFEGHAAIHFTPMPLASINPMSLLVIGKDSAGILRLNGNTLKFEKTNPVEMFRYIDTSASRNYSAGVTWSLGGVPAMPGFSLTVTRGFPAIANPTATPSAASKTGFTFSLSPLGITNADSLNISIFGQGVSIMKSVAASVAAIAISPSEMSGATIGDFMTINVIARNYSHATVSGKTHVFVLSRMVVAMAVVN